MKKIFIFLLLACNLSVYAQRSSSLSAAKWGGQCFQNTVGGSENRAIDGGTFVHDGSPVPGK